MKTHKMAYLGREVYASLDTNDCYQFRLGVKHREHVTMTLGPRELSALVMWLKKAAPHILAAQDVLHEMWGNKDLTEAQAKIEALEQRITVINENVAPKPQGIRESIIAYFEGNSVFELTQEDLAMLDKTVRQIAVGAK